MKNILNKLFVAAFALFICNNISAQDFKSSQSFTQPLALNPALMSTNNDLRVTAGYKSQWANIDNGYSAMHATVLYPVVFRPNMKIDAGLSFSNDQVGAFKTNDLTLAVSGMMELATDHFLSVSLSGGYLGTSLATQDLTFDDQYQSGSYNPNNATKEVLTDGKNSIADIGFGLLWYYAPEADKVSAYAGVSGYHFYGPKETYVKGSDASLQGRYNYITGLKFMPSNKIHISPNLRATTQAGSSEFSVGVYVDYIMTKYVAPKVKQAKVAKTEASQKIKDAKAELREAKAKLRAARKVSELDSTATEEVSVPVEEETVEVSESKEKVKRNIEPQFSIGTWYNATSRMPTVIVGAKWDRYSLGYSYDFATSAIKSSAFETSTHEITLGFYLSSDIKGARSPFHLW